MAKLKLKTWSNMYANTVGDLKELGNKIIAVSKSGEYGHIITYRHFSLTRKPRKGDLVEYYHGSRWHRGLVQETETSNPDTMITDHVLINNCIESIGNIKRIVKRLAIPRHLLKYF